MPSRVIHIRLDDWVLLGCHDVMKSGKDSIDNIPMATIVRNVLTSLIRKLQNTGQIPTYTKEEAYERAMELYNGIDDIDLDVVLKDITQHKEDNSPEDLSDLLRETLKEIENEGSPKGITTEVKISEATEIPEMPLAKLNLMKVETPTFSKFKLSAPKDRFIEWAIDSPKEIQKAVCIVYDGLPKNLWGSEKAENMIKDLLRRHIVD